MEACLVLILASQCKSLFSTLAVKNTSPRRIGQRGLNTQGLNIDEGNIGITN
jgi:hypothetical protein